MAATLTSADASAIIDQALLGANQGKAITGPAPDTDSALQPGPLPTDETEETPEELTPEQKKAKAEAEKLQKAQEDMLGKEQAAALRKEQEEQAAREKSLVGMAERLANQGKGATKKAGDRIASLPTPGNLTVPLLLLLAFFFILITYGGQTRLQWLWLVLTNNAYVTPSMAGAQQSSQPSGQMTPTGTGGGPGLVLLPARLSPSGVAGGNPYS